MNKRVLYRKEMELLNLAKDYITKENIRGYRDFVRQAFPDLFYENSFNLKSEFIELIPSDKLSETRQLLEILRLLHGYCTSGFSCTGNLNGQGFYKKDKLIERITILLNIMQEQLNRNAHYTVFYSWQSDTNSKYNRNFLEREIKQALKELNKDSPGIILQFDKDTRGEIGSPDVVSCILNKIDNSLIFVADVSSIGTINDKYVVNPNVMFELGHAICSLSDSNIVMICNTAYCDTRLLPFDLGLKRQITYKFSEQITITPEEKKLFRKQLKDAFVAIRDKKW